MGNSLRKVEYGVPTDKCAIAMRLGIEVGLFRDEGLDLSIKVVYGGPQLAAAYDSGYLKIGEIGSPPGINAIAAGKNFRIIGSGCRQRAHLFFGVRNDVENYEGLKGKRIGMLGLGSCPEWMMRRILKTEGLAPDRDVTFVPLLDDYPNIAQRVAEGSLDACLVSEPNIAIGEDMGVLKFWTAAFADKYLPTYQWIVRVARPDLIESDPELVRAVLRGCRRSAHYAAEHLDELRRFSAKQYGITESAAQRALDREVPHWQLDCDLDMVGLQRSVDLQLELGGIPKPMKAEDFVDSRFLPVEETVTA